MLKGQSLDRIIHTYGAQFLGTSVNEQYGGQFPLLFKFIDAREDLSVQLHPNDVIAQERHGSYGKTEMWYILSAEKEAKLVLGFNQLMDKETYLKHLSTGTITSVLHSEKVKVGDAFFIAPGTVHAIGAGVVLAEIQQTSDITYRIYDWNRPGLDGKMRELHNDLALDVIDFANPQSKLNYEPKDNQLAQLCSVPFFETNTLRLTKHFRKDLSKIDSFVVYMCVEGEAIVRSEGISEEEKIKKGETLLIPACIDQVEIQTQAATLLEVYVPLKHKK